MGIDKKEFIVKKLSHSKIFDPSLNALSLQFKTPVWEGYMENYFGPRTAGRAPFSEVSHLFIEPKLREDCMVTI